MCGSLGAALLLACGTFSGFAANLPAGYVDFGRFTPPNNGSEFVEVNVSSNVISMVARLAEKSEPEVANLIRGLKAIHVNVIGLNEDNRDEVEKRVRTFRGELDAQGWERLVTAQQQKQDVGVFIKTQGAESVQGVAVTVLQGHKQAVLVNIVGDIRPDKLALIGERFHIDALKQVGQKLESPEEK
jgi:hypothetical protein